MQINKLARRLNATRGGFYWFFESRERLLEAVLESWAQAGTVLFERIARAPQWSGIQKFQALADLWIKGKDHDSEWDSAVRDWARTSRKVRDTVHSVDARRIAFIEQIFLDLGYRGKDAHMRACVTYYHQVGYYALGLGESHRQRLDLQPYYTRILIERDCRLAQ